ncbi:hypothetical protein GGI43DRAFT_415394 [Trichoderma evansii]
MVKKSRKKASVQIEAALFAATSIPCFYGNLTIQPKEEAILKAMEMSHHKEGQLAFFTDGAVHIRKSKQDTVHRISSKQAQCQSRDPPLRRNMIKLATTIAYKATENNEWIVKAFTVPPRGRHYYLEAEMAGVAGALAIAISSIKISKKKPSITSHKVVILTDCLAAIHQLQKLQEHTPKRQFQDNALACKLITRSQYLHDLGVTLEVHWIPGHHPAIPGNLRADTEARRTAKSGMNVYEWELIEVGLQPCFCR